MIYFYWITGLLFALAAPILISLYLEQRDGAER